MIRNRSRALAFSEAADKVPMESLFVDEQTDPTPLAEYLWEPVHTSLKFVINPEMTLFRGEMELTFKFLQESTMICLNIDELTIEHASVTLKPEDSDQEKKYNDIYYHHEAMNTVIFEMPSLVRPNTTCTLEIGYTGPLRSDDKGFCRLKYELDGAAEFLVFSKFGKGTACAAFPCWDRLLARCTYSVVLEIPDEYVGVTSAPCFETILKPLGYKEHRYKETPPLTAGSLGIVVCGLKYIEKSENGCQVRFYAIPGQLPAYNFALDVIIKFATMMRSMFEFNTGLDRIDYVALPNLSDCALEYYGVVISRNTYLMSNGSAECRDKGEITVSIAHQLFKMWFGIVTTPASWSEYIVQEAVSVWFGDALVKKEFFNDNFVVMIAFSEIVRGMSIDSVSNVSSIMSAIKSPKDIEYRRCINLYAKPYCLMESLAFVLGEDRLLNCTEGFLSNNTFKSIPYGEIWGWMRTLSGYNAPALVYEWLYTPGLPVVKANIAWVDGKAYLELAQSRFLEDGSEAKEKVTWQIIVVYTHARSYEGMPRAKIMKKETEKWPLNDLQPGDWVKINWNMKGFYRVCYSEQMRQALLGEMLRDTFGPVDRLSILSDLYATVRANMIPLTCFFDFCERCCNDSSAEVQCFLVECLLEIMGALQTAPWSFTLRQYLGKLVRVLIEQLKSSVQELLVECADEATLRSADQLFKASLKAAATATTTTAAAAAAAATPPGAKIKPYVLYAICRYGQLCQVEKMFQLYNAHPQDEEAGIYLTAIGYCPDRKMLNKLCKLFKSKTLRVHGDILKAFKKMSSTTVGQQFAFNYMCEHWNKILQLPNGNAYFDDIMMYACKNVHGTDAMYLLKVIYQKLPGTAYEKDQRSRRILARIRVNTTLFDQADSLREWLRQRGFE